MGRSYTAWVRAKLPGEVLMMSRLDDLLAVSGVSNKEDLYRVLSRLNGVVSYLEEVVSVQKSRVAASGNGGEGRRDLEQAVGVLMVYEQTLRTIRDRRKAVLGVLKEFPLPPRTQEELDCIAQYEASKEVKCHEKVVVRRCSSNGRSDGEFDEC